MTERTNDCTKPRSCDTRTTVVVRLSSSSRSKKSRSTFWSRPEAGSSSSSSSGLEVSARASQHPLPLAARQVGEWAPLEAGEATSSRVPSAAARSAGSNGRRRGAARAGPSARRRGPAPGRPVEGRMLGHVADPVARPLGRGAEDPDPPGVGSSSPRISLSSVCLPPPLGPITQAKESGSTASVTSESTGWRPSKANDTPASSITGALTVAPHGSRDVARHPLEVATRSGASGSSSTSGQPTASATAAAELPRCCGWTNSATLRRLWPARRAGRAGAASAPCRRPRPPPARVVAAREVAVRGVKDEQGPSPVRRQDGLDAPVRSLEIRKGTRPRLASSSAQSAGRSRHSASRTAAASDVTSTGSSQVWGSKPLAGMVAQWASSIGSSLMPWEQSATGRSGRSEEILRSSGVSKGTPMPRRGRLPTVRRPGGGRLVGVRRGPGASSAWHGRGRRRPDHDLEHRRDADPDLERLAAAAPAAPPRPPRAAAEQAGPEFPGT